MPHLRRVVTVFVLTLSTCGVALAQQNGCLERTIPLTIRTANPGPDIALSTADLQGSYLGKAVQIGSFGSADSIKPRIVFLVEISGSMQPTGSLQDWNFPLDVTRDLILRTPSDVEVGVAFFTNSLQHVIDPTTDHNKPVAEVEAVRSLRGEAPREVGEPPLWDAIRGGADLLAPAHVGDAVYAIVHGREHGSKTTVQIATQAMVGTGIRLFAVLMTDQPRVPYGRLPFQPSESQKQFLQIVNDTGGTQITIPRGSGLSRMAFPMVEAALDGQYRQLFHVYPLTINLPEPVDKPREWRLNLRDKKSGIELVYPKTLFPCS